MSDQSDSCFIEKLGYYVELSESDRKLLANFEEDERQYGKGEVIRAAGQPVSELYVVKQGWLFTSTSLPDGRRQLLSLHFPGDMLGLSEVPLKVSPHDVQSLTNVVLCPYPKRNLDKVFLHSPQLTALFFSFAMIDELVLLDRIRVLGRMSARERIAHFLLEIFSRLRITNPQLNTSFRLPLTQGEIGDAVGLTNVYVSKSIARLREEGLISMSDGIVTLEDEATLREMCDFEDRYRELDTKWFPERLEK